MNQASLFGRKLRFWRKARAISQLELALRASSTPRYICFIENGRSRPSEQMVHRLADAMNVPIRERNDLLESAGFARAYSTRTLDEALMSPFSRAVGYIMRAHEPFPAVVVNRWWDVIDANSAAIALIGMMGLRKPLQNLVDLMFADDSPLRACCEDWGPVAHAFLNRMRREVVHVPCDERLQNLVAFAERQLAETEPPSVDPDTDLMVCPTMRLGGRRVSVIGVIASFGSAREVTLDELRVECMYPRDSESEEFFRGLAEVPPLRVAQ